MITFRWLKLKLFPPKNLTDRITLSSMGQRIRIDDFISRPIQWINIWACVGIGKLKKGIYEDVFLRLQTRISLKIYRRATIEDAIFERMSSKNE